MTVATESESTESDTTHHAPWWRIGTVWLVIGGPLAVVIAGVVTAVIAWQGADDILVNSRAASGVQGADVPAVQGRNHAITGGR